MQTIHKSIHVYNDNDYAIVQHHISKLEMEFECMYKDNNVIDFFDDYLYQIIKKFMTHTHIKSKINKKKDK